MRKPFDSRGGFKRLLVPTVFVSAGVVGMPVPANASDVNAPPGGEWSDRREGTDVADLLDPDAEHRAGTSRRLAGRLARMNPFDATRVVAIAALSPSVRIRQTIAESLASSFPLVGDDFVLDHLAGDPDTHVRSAARRASAVRGVAFEAVSLASFDDDEPPPRVLVIDDHPRGRAAICARLSDLGCDAMGASSSIANHDVAWRELVDIVITNDNPPSSDGPTLIGKIRRFAPDLPAIVLRYDEAATLDDLARAIQALSR